MSTPPPLSSIPDASPASRLDELDGLVREGARMVVPAVALALTGFAATGWVSDLQGAPAWLALGAALGALALGVAYAILVRQGSGVRWGHPLVAASLLAVVSYGLASFALSDESSQVGFAAVVLVSSGFLLFSEGWLAALVTAVWLPWGAISLWSGAPSWDFQAAMLATSTLLGVAVHQQRVVALRTVQSERVRRTHEVAALEQHLRGVRETEERFRKLAEASFEGILLHRDRTVLDVNASLAATFGLAPAAVRGIDILQLFAPENHDLVLAKIGFGEGTHFEARGVAADGSRLDLEVRARPLRIEGEAAGVLAIRDVSDRHRRDLIHARLLEDLRRSNQELTDFAHVASHDLRAPLRTIGSFCEILNEDFAADLPDEAREHLDRISRAAGRMDRLLSALLDYARVGTRGKALTRVDANAALDQAVSNLGAAIAETRAVLERTRLPIVRADDVQLIQVFQNLLSNALKFRGAETPHVRISAAREDQMWRFSITDKGIGIDPRHQERIFQIFERLHAEAEIPGTGIGLALCKRIVERHGGTLMVTSQTGNGATFSFTLPAEGLTGP